MMPYEETEERLAQMEWEFSEASKPSAHQMGSIHSFANWLAWKAVIYGGAFMLYRHFPATGLYILIGFICCGF